jgi:hypothetical protein
MSSHVKNIAKRITPPDIWNNLGRMYYEMLWRFNTKGKISRQRIRTFHEKHRGQRCFIIGNGPSLQKMDLSPLKNEITFGMNRIYLLFPEIGFKTTYLVSVNRLVIEQFAEDIAKLPITQFLSQRGQKHIKFSEWTMFLYARSGLKFSLRPDLYIYDGPTVTYVAMQLAYYMGFKQAILIGVDHNFQTTGPANQEVISAGDDPNHFAANYFGKGVKWQLPNLEESENAYKIAREVYTKNGRTIIDATVDGKLQVYPKVDFTKLF